MFFKLKFIILVSILFFSITVFAQQNENNSYNFDDVVGFVGVAIGYNQLSIEHNSIIYYPTEKNIPWGISSFFYFEIFHNFYILYTFSMFLAIPNYKYWDFSSPDGSNIDKNQILSFDSLGFAYSFKISDKINIRPAIQIKWAFFEGDKSWTNKIVLPIRFSWEAEVTIPMLDINIMFIFNLFPKSKSFKFHCFDLGFSIFIPGIFNAIVNDPFYDQNKIKSYIFIYLIYFPLNNINLKC